MGKVLQPQGVFPEQRGNEIVTWETSDLFAPANGRAWPRYNPDSLVGRKGMAIYEAMMADEQVKAVVTFKRDAIIGRGWQFRFDADDTRLPEETREERIAAFTRILDVMDRPFIDALCGVMSASIFGYSIAEKVYDPEVEFNGGRIVGLRALTTRQPGSFELITDQYGVLEAVFQVTGGRRQEIDSDRLVMYAHDSEWDPYYGRSDLRAAYRSWYTKDVVGKLWATYLERMAGGFLVAKETGDSNLTPAQRTSLEAMVRNARNISGIVLPRGVELEAIMPSNSDQFKQAVEFHDLAIAKALLVPNLMGISHTGQTGAYSQSQTQLEAFLWTLNRQAQSVAACLNKQLFRDLGDQNWGDGLYPEFSFKPGTVDQAKWIVDTWAKFVGANVVVSTAEDERWLRKLLDAPVREEGAPGVGDEIAARNQERQIATAQAMPQPKEEPPPQFTVPVNVTVPVAAAPAAPVADPATDGTDTAVAGAAALRVHVHGSPRSGMTAFTRAVQRVNFSVIEKRMGDVAARTVPDVAKAMARAVRRALGDDESVRALTDSDVADIAAFELNGTDVGKVKAALVGSLTEAWNIGQSMGANEIDRARGEPRPADSVPLHMASLRDKAAAYFDANGFRMAGNLRDGARAIIQQNLQQAVKSGWTVAQTRANIWDALLTKGFTDRDSVRGAESDESTIALLDELWEDTEETAAAYLNTLIRTNTFEAMNEARYAEFTDPELADFVQALEYSAVMDERTTEVCSAMDGRVYRADNVEVWDTRGLRPPLHYNCRSVLIPVTILDGWSGEESDLPPADVQPQEGFG